MLSKVLAAAPAGLTAHLAEFNEYSRHALNSYVHSGIHPLRRVREGFPVEMALNLIRISNGLMHMAYRMLAVLMGSRRRMDKVTHLYREPLKTAVFSPSLTQAVRNPQICLFFVQFRLFLGFFVPHSSRIGPLQAHLGL